MRGRKPRAGYPDNPSTLEQHSPRSFLGLFGLPNILCGLCQRGSCRDGTSYADAWASAARLAAALTICTIPIKPIDFPIDSSLPKSL